ncbi:MAG: prepilin-type N-terminal cleavage/methylation domain-containing protein, partial [Bacillota bacterium]|nr:prepilin-type N-terminal cleavage/methylation domain-containing protein [Bacillota bacterium]
MFQKKNKKGFTLVEVIVVLVILAVLAAILIPSMIGWIDKANKKKDEATMNLLAKAA